jgi:hypothetical protein
LLGVGDVLLGGRIVPGAAHIHINNKSDNKLSPVVDPQVSHFIPVPLAAMKSQKV